MLYLWYIWVKTVLAYFTRMCVCLTVPKESTEITRNTCRQMLVTLANCVHFDHFFHNSIAVPKHPPIELLCSHICTRSKLYSTKIQILILFTNWCWLVDTCSSLCICKWFVGFYLFCPVLNWNFALGEIYQFKQSFESDTAFLPSYLNKRTREPEM